MCHHTVSCRAPPSAAGTPAALLICGIEQLCVGVTCDLGASKWFHMMVGLPVRPAPILQVTMLGLLLVAVGLSCVPRCKRRVQVLAYHVTDRTSVTGVTFCTLTAGLWVGVCV